MRFRGASQPVLFDPAAMPQAEDTSGRLFTVPLAGAIEARRGLKCFERAEWRTAGGRLILGQLLWRLARLERPEFAGLSLSEGGGHEVLCCLVAEPGGPTVAERLPLSAEEAAQLTGLLLTTLWASHEARVVGLRFQPDMIVWNGGDSWRWQAPDLMPSGDMSSELARRDDLVALAALVRRLTEPETGGRLAEALTRLEAPGVSAPVALQSALACLGCEVPRPQLPAPAPLLGCESELATLEAWLAQTQQSKRLQTVWLGGDGGVAPWDLFQALAHQVAPKGLRVAAVRCTPGEAPDVVLHALALQLDLLMARQLAGAESMASWRPLTELVPSHSQGLTTALPPDLVRVHLVRAFYERIQQLSRQAPLCLALIDYAAASDPIPSLVHHLKRHGDGLAVLLVLGTDHGEPDADDNVLHLRPLFESEVAQLAQAHCPGTPLGEAAIQAVWSYSGGHPALVYRLCLHWLKRRALGPQPDGTWAPLDSGPRTEPSELVRELLRAFGTLGTLADLAILKALMDLPEPAFFELLETALDGGWLRQKSGWLAFWRPEDAARFATTLLPEDSLRWHRRLAAVTALAMPVRARHAALGGQDALAAELAIEAGYRLQAIGAVESAADLFERGLRELSLDDGRRVEVIEVLAGLWLGLGRYAQAVTLLEPALLRLQGGEAEDAGRLHAALAAAYVRLDQPDLAAAASEQARLTLGGDAVAPRVRVNLALADASLARGERERALALAREAHGWAELADEAVLLAEAHLGVGRIMLRGPVAGWLEGLDQLVRAVRFGLRSGQLEVACQAFGLAADTQLALDQLSQARESLQHRQALLVQLGREDAAHEIGLQMAGIALRMGLYETALLETDSLAGPLDGAHASRSWARAASVRAVASLCLGYVNEPLRMLEQSLSTARQLQDRVLELEVLGPMVLGLGFLGKLARAEEVCQSGLALAATLGDRRSGLRFRADLAALAWLASDVERSERLYQGLRHEAAELGLGVTEARACLGLARVALSRGLLDVAQDDAAEALRKAIAAGHRALRAEVTLFQGHVALASGSPAEAAAAFGAALAAAEEIASPHHRALALYGLGQSASDPIEAGAFGPKAFEQLAVFLGQLTVSGKKDFLSWPERQAIVAGATRPGDDGQSRALVTSLPGTRSSLLSLLKGGQSAQWGAESFTLLDEIFTLVTARLPLADLLVRMNETFIRISKASRGMVFLADEDGGMKLRNRQLSTDSPVVMGHDLPMALVLERVRNDGQTLWVTDAPADPAYAELSEVQDGGVRGVLCIPLKIRDDRGERVLGCLYGDRQSTWEDIGDKEIGLLELMARYISVTIEIGVLQDDSSRKTHRLQMLNDLTRALAGTLDMDRLLNLALMQILQVTHGEQGYLLFGDELAIRASLDSRGQVIAEVQVSRSVIAKVTRDRQPLTIMDVGQDEELQQKASLMIRNVKSVMCVPLLLDDRLLGLIYISSSSANKAFSRHDLDLMTAIAAQVALALQNAQAYETIKELNLSLEAKVKARTAELESTYRELTDTQAQLLETEKLATIGTLAGGVAHEINNPLGAVLTNAQLLIGDVTDPDQLDSLRMIEEGARRCKEIVEALLKYSKPPQAAYRPIELPQIIEETLAFVERQLQQDGTLIALEGATVATVMGDATELRQVMAHLLLNAMDAVREGADVGEGRINVAVIRQLEGITVTIRDNGTGMTQEVLKRIFDPFYTTKKVGSGTGLGLSVCQRVIEKHGGRISAASVPGEGSVFTIELPAA